MHPDISGKTALVTGGAQRLGRAVCEGLAARGVQIAIHYNTSKAEAETFAGELSNAGIAAKIFQAELADANARNRLFASVTETFGQLDILINCASIFPEDTIHSADAQSIAHNHEVNAIAPLDLSRALAAQDIPGVIVNFLDTRIWDNDDKHVSYHLSKRTLFALTRMMAVQFAPKVRVNAVAPGLILPPAGKDETYLETLKHTNPLNAYGNADDIVRAVLFLVESPFITGQIVYVDGGRHMRSHFYG